MAFRRSDLSGEVDLVGAEELRHTEPFPSTESARRHQPQPEALALGEHLELAEGRHPPYGFLRDSCQARVLIQARAREDVGVVNERELLQVLSVVHGRAMTLV